MEVAVRIGTTQKRIEEVSDFTKGTIIELDTMANEPVDIMVNGNLMARGEVVVVDDNFAVRITEIVK
jgi:flagellar motor switch protein FliN/FliY